MEPDKGLCDGPAHLGVHGEAGPVPVHAGAQGAQLRVDRLPVLLLPLPHLPLQIEAHFREAKPMFGLQH
jgi:hypothetical protein